MDPKRLDHKSANIEQMFQVAGSLCYDILFCKCRTCNYITIDNCKLLIIFKEPNSNKPTKVVHSQKLANQSMLNDELLTVLSKILRVNQ